MSYDIQTEGALMIIDVEGTQWSLVAWKAIDTELSAGC